MVFAIGLSWSTYKDPVSRICLDGSASWFSLTVASWCRFLAGTDEQGKPIEIQDPMADELHRQGKAAGKDPRPFLGMREIFGDELPQSPVFVEQVGDVLQSLYDVGARATLAKYI